MKQPLLFMRYTLVLLTAPCLLMANPSGHNVVHGEAQVILQGDQLSLRTSDKAIIEWQNFSINKGETTRFLQPNNSSSVLNRVVSSNPSRLFGTLKSNGKVYLINQNGIIIGKEGHLQTASLIASTLDILNEDFIAGGDLCFEGSSRAHILNEGTIEALGGDAILIGQFVSTTGEIKAPNGLSGIGCGEKVLIKADGEERLFILTPIQTALEQPAGIQQKGSVTGSSVELKASGNPYALAILHEGSIDALGVQRENGNVFLVAEEGNLYVEGAINAENGNVHLHADQVVVADGARIDVSGEFGGGSVYAGKDALFTKNPKAIFVQTGAEIIANARENGDGGNVILWADEVNSFEGLIEAKGGLFGGSGGFVEISSSKAMIPKGKVDTSSPSGPAGRLLLDPCEVIITSLMPTTGTVVPSMYPGMCPMTATSYDFSSVPMNPAYINSGDLVNFLTCNHVTIDASGPGPGAAGTGTITVVSDVQWTAVGMPNPDPTTLTLIADDTISINGNLRSFSTTATALDVITISAPIVDIRTTTASVIFVRTASGHIQITAPTSLTIAGDTSTVAVSTESMSAGDIKIDTGDLTVTNAGGVGACLIGADHDLIINATGDIELTADPTLIQIQSSGPPIAMVPPEVNITAGGHLHLTGGAGGLAGVVIGNDQGPVSLDIGQEIQLIAGNGAGLSLVSIGAATVSGTGDLTILNCGDVTLQGGTGPNSQAILITGNPLMVPGGNGKIDITCNGSVFNITGGSTATSEAGIITAGTLATNDISINFTNPLSTMTALSTISGGQAAIQTRIGGDITITGLRDLSLTGNTGGTSNIQVGTMGGNLQITSSGAAVLTNNANIINQFPSGSLDFTMGSLAINGTTDTAYVQSQGALTLNALSGNIALQSGPVGVQAYIQSAGDLSITTMIGDVTVTSSDDIAYIESLAAIPTFDIGRDVIVTSGNMDAYIHSTGSFSMLHAGRNIVVTANGSDAGIVSDVDLPSITAGGYLEIIAAGTGSAALVADGSIGIDVTDYILVNGQVGQASIAVQMGMMPTLDITAGGNCHVGGNVLSYILNFIGDTTLDISGSLSIESSPILAGVSGTAAIGAALIGQGNLSITAADFSITSGIAPSFVFTGTPPEFMMGPGGDGNISIHITGPGGLSLTGGAMASSICQIVTNGTATNNDISIVLDQPSADITMTATFAGANSGTRIATLTGGNITINSPTGAGNDLIMSSASAASPSTISVGAAGGNLLAIMQRSIEIGGFSNMENLNPTGTLTLVADNLYPAAPFIGFGVVSLGAGATLTTASGMGLFIYTSVNSVPEIINGMLNGQPIGVVVPQVNTDTAQWGIYYPANPNMKPGMPFTVFYKGETPFVPIPPVNPTVISSLVPGTQADNDFIIVLGEAFQLWRTYFDRTITDIRVIELEFLNVLDIPSWELAYFYRFHRNYNTLKLDRRL